VEVVDVVGSVLLFVCVLLIAMVARRWLLSRSGGTLEMSLRERHWRFGVGRYDGDRLSWYATFSLSPRPRRTFARSGLRVVGRRPPRGGEALHVVHDSVILECATAPAAVEIAVPSSALPGFLAWLEAAPRHVAA
jgi:hypothetical protein